MKLRTHKKEKLHVTFFLESALRKIFLGNNNFLGYMHKFIIWEVNHLGHGMDNNMGHFGGKTKFA